MKSIKLICNSSSLDKSPPSRLNTLNRTSLFLLLCQQLPESEYRTYTDFSINEDVTDADYIILFDTHILKKKNYKVFLDTVAKTNLDNTIFDVTKDIFDDETLGPVLTLCIVCAGFVTCSDAFLQERIYEATGRLAHIVNTPVPDVSFKKPDDNKYKNVINPTVLWFGSSDDIFSIRKEQVRFKRIETIVAKDWQTTDKKKIETALSFADIVYFPKTFTPTGEDERVRKTLFAITQGKFVVAPDLPVSLNSLNTAATFRQALEVFRKQDITLQISLAQTQLKETFTLDNSFKQFKKALELAPLDTFQDQLSGLLESGELKI